jgi:threonine dehydrogenase-like Zn-dependent dehydrogenase
MADDPEAARCQVTKALALWFTGPRQAALKPAFVARLQSDELLVRAVVSGISRGTESLVFQGLVPDSEQARMRCPFQEGEFPFPVKYGYAMVGIVEDGPAERIGETVLCLHPHQTRFAIPRGAAFPVQPETTAQRAVLAPQMETALNALWDAAPRAGDRIAVVGGGVIGCLVAYLCARMPGCSVILIDPDESRRRIATALGVAFATPDETLPGNNDLVFHASGTAGGLQTALSLAGFEASVIELSWYGTTLVPVQLGAAFHSQRLLLRSSQVGTVAPDRRARWNHARRLTLALSLTADPRLDILLDSTVLFEDLPEALPEILGKAGALCVRIIYSED